MATSDPKYLRKIVYKCLLSATYNTPFPRRDRGTMGGYKGFGQRLLYYLIKKIKE